MPRLIDGDALIAKWEEEAKHIEVFDHRGMVYGAINDVKRQPTIEAEPKRKKGRWVWLSSTYDRLPCEMRFWCSECHHETIVHTSGTSEPWEHYCPNCSAEMRGEDDD